MATQTIQLTPHTDQTHAVVEIAKELSGAHWCNRFRGSNELSDLRPSFQEPVSSFLWALESAKATVKRNATYIPKERAYLMLWSWMIFNNQTTPDKVPTKEGVLIEWAHSTKETSFAAAQAMVEAFDMTGLRTKPAGESSLHCIREAIDMSISWSGTLNIQNRDGSEIEITSTPRSGMNPDLIKVGASYGVMKFSGGSADRPHWSSNGK